MAATNFTFRVDIDVYIDDETAADLGMSKEEYARQTLNAMLTQEGSDQPLDYNIVDMSVEQII
jgi:hypothetical protein